MKNFGVIEMSEKLRKITGQKKKKDENTKENKDKDF